ncbi:MAG: helix-turn-helix domain-containing protein, partial [Saccharothrix sp.]|nr:helix-turn-helix domain-containing protein [Saccharothrix sp.]
LRREELAQLAGISADYYIRFEQGRLDNVSDQVLDALARALRLDDTERGHLRTLVRPHRGTPGRTPVRPQQQWLLDSIAGPAYVLGARTDVLAWNDLACALYGVDLATLDPPNMARLIFLDPTARTLWVPWEDKARDTVGGLRVLAGRYPDDRGLQDLLAELHDRNPDFTRLWAEHDVWTSPFGEKHFHHPEAGDFSLHYEAFAVPGEPDRTLITYTAEPDSPGATALRALGGRP